MKISKHMTMLMIMILILASCSNSPKHTFTKEINENNIEICTNSGGPKFIKSLYTIEETLSLGGEEPEPKLFQPYGVLVDDQGFLFFIDEYRIKKFSPQGDFISLISQPGQGPGEITNPRLEAIIGDTLYVDQFVWSGRRKYELFNTDGKYIERIFHPRLKVEQKQGRRKYTLGPIGPSKFLFYTQNPIETGNFTVDLCKYGIADRDGNIIKMLDLQIEPFSSWIKKENGSTIAPFIVGAEAFLSRNIYILSGIGEKIHQFSLEGELQRVTHLNLPQEPVTAADIAQVLKSRERPGLPTMLESTDFPEKKPIACSIIEDDEGHIWVKKGADYYSALKESATYMLFSAEGEYLADQTFPCDVSIIKKGMVYGFTKTENDLMIFKRFILIKN